jgi:alpha-L-fucosidase
MKKNFTLLLLLLNFTMLSAQVHDISKNYVSPTEPAVQANLKKWQQLKFGLFMHWGTYSQWGVVEK